MAAGGWCSPKEGVGGSGGFKSNDVDGIIRCLGGQYATINGVEGNGLSLGRFLHERGKSKGRGGVATICREACSCEDKVEGEWVGGWRSDNK
jgi:hypothetical protein